MAGRILYTSSVIITALMLIGCDGALLDAPKIVGEQIFPTQPSPQIIDIAKLESIVLGNGGDVTMFIATIHGNEQAGTPLLRKMAEYLRQNRRLLDGRKVVLIPVANPYGAARNSRYNANNVDLNRNFGSGNRQNNDRNGHTGLSEPESRAIKMLIDQHRPDRVITLHQPLNCIDYDGPAAGIAQSMSKHCDLPVKKLGSRPGSLGSYVGITLNRPIITVELPRGADNLSSWSLWQKYGQMLVAGVTYSQLAK